MVIGSKLGDRYEIVERLAAGGMGTVYVADDRRLGRRVALKLLKDELAGDDRFVERFRREARSAASLSHPGIANVFDYGEDAGRHFIVMELAEGRDLARVLREDGPLSPDRAARIGAQIGAALGHAHAAGMVHRDVKPANVIVGDTDQVKVTDFGIARAVGDSTLTATGSVLGTAQYLSPEQASGQPASARSDVYCLGIVLYEMLTGTVPFTGDSAVAVAMRHVNEEVPVPSELNPDVPGELDDVVRRATAKEPASRFASGAEVADALRQSLIGTREMSGFGGAVPATQELSTGSQTVYPIPGTRWDPEKLGRSVLIAFVLLGVLALALLAFVITGGGGEKTGEQRQRNRRDGAQTQETSPPSEPVVADIPESIVGLPYKEEQERLEAAGFQVLVEVVESDLEKDAIVTTEPPPGTTDISTDTPITLFVSSGEGDPEEDEGEDDESGGPPSHAENKSKGKDKD